MYKYIKCEQFKAAQKENLNEIDVAARSTISHFRNWIKYFINIEDINKLINNHV
jgi:hypothetical protein